MKPKDIKIKKLQKALVAGEKSGFVKIFNPKENLNQLHKKFLLGE